MISVDNKYDVCLDALAIPKSTRRNLPAWYHIGSDKLLRGFNVRKSVKCLQTKHNTKTISDMLQIIERLNINNQINLHQDLKECPCHKCANDRERNCKDPNECTQTMEMIIRSLTPNFQPSNAPLNTNGLSPTPQRLKENEKAKKEDGIITFNPTICNISNLEVCFRIFMNSKSRCCLPAKRPTRQRNNPCQTIILLNGACIINKEEEASVGSGLWYGEDNEMKYGTKNQSENPILPDR